MKNLFLAIVLVFAGSYAFAQPTDLGPTPNPSNNPNAAVPVDGGASLLIAAGVAYGVKRMKAKKA